VDLRAGLDDLEKRKFLILPGLELRPLGPPISSLTVTLIVIIIIIIIIIILLRAPPTVIYCIPLLDV
jgi:hypothetical protein